MPRLAGDWWLFAKARKLLFASLAVHLLLCAGAALWITQTVSPGPSRRPDFCASRPPAQASLRALEHRVKLARHRGGAPPAARRVVSLSPSRVALPALPATSSLPFTRPAVLASGRHLTATGALGKGDGPGMGGGDVDEGRQLANLCTILRVKEPRVGIVLQVPDTLHDPRFQGVHRLNSSGPDWATYDYIEHSFAPDQIAEYGNEGLFLRSDMDVPRPTLGSALLSLLNSPRQFDAIYVLSNFSAVYAKYQDTMIRVYHLQDCWPLIRQRVREHHVKLYLHIVTKDRAGWSEPLLNEVIAFARSTGGEAKFGPLPRPGEEIAAPADRSTAAH